MATKLSTLTNKNVYLVLFLSLDSVTDFVRVATDEKACTVGTGDFRLRARFLNGLTCGVSADQTDNIGDAIAVKASIVEPTEGNKVGIKLVKATFLNLLFITEIRVNLTVLTAIEPTFICRKGKVVGSLHSSLGSENTTIMLHFQPVVAM